MNESKVDQDKPVRNELHQILIPIVVRFFLINSFATKKLLL